MQAYDSNCSGSIDGEEFAFMCRDLCLPLTPKEVQDVMASLDADKSGEISYDEFYQVCDAIIRHMAYSQLLRRVWWIKSSLIVSLC